jgi:hypothetical protein
MLQFCPHCRNADVEKEIAATGADTATAACPECGGTYDFPYLTLYTLEGAPASGKSTTAGRLHGTIDLAVYEGDMHMDLIAGTLDWDEICRLDFRICMTLHSAGKQTLFVGGVHPHDLADSPETQYFDGIERCALVCSDEEMERRVRERADGDPEGLELSLDVNRWYREQGPAEGIAVIDTGEHGPEAVGERVRAWLEGAGWS